ncbi:MAG: hypothetical protein RL173_491 [Fibrobacterota bacterium]|jgi:tyrosine-protein kinase Etk/Wzc
MAMIDHSSGEASLTDWVDLIIKKWKFLVLTTLIGAGAGQFVSRWKPSIYQADALIQIEIANNGESFGQYGELEDMFGSTSAAETEIEVLRSRMVLEPVSETLHLRNLGFARTSYRRLLGKEGRIRVGELSLPPLPEDAQSTWQLKTLNDTSLILVDPMEKELFQVPVGQAVEFVVGIDTLRLRVDFLQSEPGELFLLSRASPSWALRKVRGPLAVKEKGKNTGIIELRYEDTDPELASIVLNEIVRSYMRQNIDSKSAEARKTLEFLRQQIPYVKARLDSADSVLNSFRLSMGTVDLTSEAKIALEQQVDFGKQILELEQRKKELSRLYEENHPQIAALNAQMSQVRQTMGRSSGKVRKLPKTQQEVLKLTRDVTVATEFYQAMLDKMQQLEVVKAGEVGSARVLDTSIVPTSPVRPDRGAIAGFGVVAGFLIGFLILVGRKAFDKGIQDASSLERMTGLTVIAQIPVSKTQVRIARNASPPRLLSIVDPSDLAVESIRSLRTAVEFTLLSRRHKVLCISGLTPGVGKSFLSANLATLLAAAGKKVVLVDADLRMGQLNSIFGVNASPGLAELILGKASMESVIQSYAAIPDFWFVPCGNCPGSPSELLSSPAFDSFVGELRGRFDVVIIDTPPVLLVTDASIALRSSDHCLLILEQGQHSPDDIREAVRRTKIRPELDASLVLNKCAIVLGNYQRYKSYGVPAPKRPA